VLSRGGDQGGGQEGVTHLPPERGARRRPMLAHVASFKVFTASSRAWCHGLSWHPGLLSDIFSAFHNLQPR